MKKNSNYDIRDRIVFGPDGIDWDEMGNRSDWDADHLVNVVLTPEQVQALWDQKFIVPSRSTENYSNEQFIEFAQRWKRFQISFWANVHDPYFAELMDEGVDIVGIRCRTRKGKLPLPFILEFGNRFHMASFFRLEPNLCQCCYTCFRPIPTGKG